MSRSWFNPLMLSGLLSACAYAYLSFSSQSYAAAGFTELATVALFCGTLCFATWFYYHKNDISIPVKTLLFWALCFRLIGISGFPVLEDDFYRYLWDGRMLVETGSPYTQAPADFFDAENIDAKFEEILGHINYPNIVTVYGPVCQFVFAISYLLAPGEVWLLQLIFGLFDFALILLLLRLAPAKWVLLYAWSPLIIKEFAYSAHTDILGVFFLFAALLAKRSSNYLLSALLLSLAVGSKVFAIILVPFLLGFNWRNWLYFFAGILLITLPFSSLDPWLPGGLTAMANQWLFNAPFYQILFTVLPPLWVKFIMLMIFVSLWCLYVWRFNWKDKDLIPRGDYLYGILFLCMPVVNAWYMVWLLPFAVIFPSRWPWTASVSVLLCYVVGSQPEQPLPLMILIIEYGLIGIALFFDLNKKNKYRLAT